MAGLALAGGLPGRDALVEVVGFRAALAAAWVDRGGDAADLGAAWATGPVDEREGSVAVDAGRATRDGALVGETLVARGVAAGLAAAALPAALDAAGLAAFTGALPATGFADRAARGGGGVLALAASLGWGFTSGLLAEKAPAAADHGPASLPLFVEEAPS